MVAAPPPVSAGKKAGLKSEQDEPVKVNCAFCPEKMKLVDLFFGNPERILVLCGEWYTISAGGSMM